MRLREKLFITTMLLCGIVTASCKKVERTPQLEPVPKSIRKDLTDRYLSISYEGNWPSLKDCDASLWAGLAATQVDVDLSLAFDDGRPYRRPSHDCYELGNSHSTVSNDMITGLLWGIWVRRDKELFSAFKDYAIATNYLVGEPDTAIGSVIVRENVRALMGLMSYNFGLGSTAWGLVRRPYFKSDVDYVRHIQVLQILLFGELTGYVTPSELDVMCSYDDGSDYLMETACSRYNGRDGGTDLSGLVGREPPGYVRGHDREAFEIAHKLFTVKIWDH